MTYEEICLLLTERHSEMSARLQKAGRYILSHPDEVGIVSMRQLAEAAGVHPTAMVRLAHFLGFDGFSELRDPFVQRLRRSSTDKTVSRARHLQDKIVSEDRLLEAMQQTAQENVARFYEQNDSKKIVRMAKKVLKAQRVFILGLRSSYPAAYSLAYSLGLVRPNGILLDGPGGIYQDPLRDATGRDVLFAISMSPYTRSTLEIVDYAAEKGCKILALTDNRLSPLAKGAEDTLIVGNETPSFFHSVAAFTTAIEVLVAILMRESGQKGLNHLLRVREQMDRFHTYVEPAHGGTS